MAKQQKLILLISTLFLYSCNEGGITVSSNREHCRNTNFSYFVYSYNGHNTDFYDCTNNEPKIEGNFITYIDKNNKK